MRCPTCDHETPDGSLSCLACGSHLSLAGISTSATRPILRADSLSAVATIASTDRPVGIGPGTMIEGYLFASRYRIKRILGSGGMGAVYQARDEALGIDVALKVIRPDILQGSGNDEFERRFKQELLTARQVTHRNVIRIHDLGDCAGVKYITMQYVEGTDLATVLAAGPLPLPRVLALAKQLAAGVAAAHDAGVVHRDLKPANILIDAADNLYISDFGLAKSLEPSLAGVTRTGELLGTPRYISPEQLLGRTVDHRSDLYAIGFILFEMATGGSPFSANSAIELMICRLEATPAEPKQLNPDVPEFFSRAITRCLQREPDARYSTAHDLRADLESGHAAPVPSIPARSVSIVLPLPATRRSAWIAGAVAAIALAVAVPASLRYVEASRTGDTGPAAAPVVAQKHVAVLPFRVVGDQEALAPIAAGVEETLTARLFQVPAVTLAPAAAVERAAAKDSLAAISRELGANLLVSGTVQGNQTALRVTVTIDDTAAGTRIWARDFSGVAGDLLTIEDQIYSSMVEALGIELTGEALVRAVSHPTENIDAYQSYLRGRNAMRAQQDAKNVLAAIAFYEGALKQDPQFARAYAGIADAAVRLYRLTRENSWLDRALSAALQAKRLDERLVEVRLALGSVYQTTGKTAEAIAELSAASELAPSSDDVFRRLGRAYLATGRGDEAIASYEKAVTLNPYYWVSYSALGFAHLQLGSYQKAIESYLKTIELEPDNVTGHNDLGAAYMQMGRFEEAAASFSRALELQPIAQTYTNLGIAYASAGKHDAAIPMFEKAVELSPNAEMFIGNLGDGYRWAQQPAKAAAAYDRAIALALKDLQVNPRNAAARGNLALYYAKKGDRARAAQMIASARAIDGANVNLAYAEAVIRVLAGDSTAAFAPLEDAFAAGYPLSAAQHDPDLRPLVSLPAFNSLANKFRERT